MSITRTKQPVYGALQIPSENNKVFCGQFVADELIANDIEPGYYCIRLHDTTYDAIYNDLYFQIGENSSYNYYFMDEDDFHIIFNTIYNISTKTLTFSFYDAVNDRYQNCTNFHVDVFKVG